MCGIAGVYNLNGVVDACWIKAMTDALRNRGPDDEGYLAADVRENRVYPLISSDSRVEGQWLQTFEHQANLFLGHRRLSIIDTSVSGHQPMSNPDRTLWVVYNGEIYNYLELREELKDLGYAFKTRTDTEVLLAAYEAWQERCLERFNGMWSFVIYDARQNRIFGSRDRFGVKPFYYCMKEDYFAFASEMKALIGLPFMKAELNPAAVFDYLVLNLMEHETAGFFKDIQELPPSFAFFYDLYVGRMKKWQYYTLTYADRREDFDPSRFAGHAAKVRELLSNAISLRLRADVPVGTCLSGGLDSSTIVCFIHSMLKRENLQQIGRVQRVFTANYDNASIDESKWAKMVVDSTQTEWFQTFPKSKELLNDLEDLIYTQDIPFGSTSLYAQYRIMKLARENGVKVLLDGQGGDELLTGYQVYYASFFMEIIMNAAVHDLCREWKGIKNSPINTKYLLRSLIELIVKMLAPNSVKAWLIKFGKMETSYLNANFFDEHRDRMEVTKDLVQTSLNKTLHQYICGYSLKSLLRYEDRNSMRFSVEARTPFADDVHLIEYVFRVPSSYKIHSGWSKYLLRAATKGILPEPIRLRRDKIGFATPEYQWLNEIGEALRDYIGPGMADFLNVRRIRADWEKILANQERTGASRFWRYINFAVWRRIYRV